MSDIIFILGVVILTDKLPNFHYLCILGRFFSSKSASHQKKFTPPTDHEEFIIVHRKDFLVELSL